MKKKITKEDKLKKVKKIILGSGEDKREFKVSGHRGGTEFDVVCDTCENEHAFLDINGKLYCGECGKLEFFS